MWYPMGVHELGVRPTQPHPHPSRMCSSHFLSLPKLQPQNSSPVVAALPCHPLSSPRSGSVWMVEGGRGQGGL